MKSIKLFLTFGLLLSSLFIFSQQKPEGKKVKVTGKIVDKGTNQPLEYSTISLVNTTTNKVTSGGITDSKGDFSFDSAPGTFNIKVEFISFKSTEIKAKTITSDTNLGTISLVSDATQLNEVVIKTEKSNVEIKLDKKIYNVGQDMTVKGGTASDVLDNVPSVTVDGDGNVSLRGNDNVKILIDGRPSNAINIADALRNIPADALDKIEVITNPSARYDAEGGAGIINIVLKKGKTNGLNGTFIATTGTPKNNTIVGNLNYKTDEFNLFSTLGYTNNNSPGVSYTNSNYLNSDGSIYKNIVENTDRQRAREGMNYTIGVDWFLDKSLTWTNAINYRKNDGKSPETSSLLNSEAGSNFNQFRFNDQFTATRNVEYVTNFTKKFKKDGHKLTVDATVSRENDNDSSQINTSYSGNTDAIGYTQSTKNFQEENKKLIQTDYVLPIGKQSQFEAGYRGNFNDLLTDYNVSDLDNSGNFISNPNFTNKLDYKERINALYTQFGTKISKFSVLLGMRWEDSNIDINLLTTNSFNNKKYNNFFPSAFFTYEINDNSSLSLNYSKRISRPRSRFINPFSNYTSNINIFQGNPDINPSFTDAFDLGYLTKWKKITFSTSAYFNKTKNVFQFIRRPNGETVTTIVNGVPVETPVILTTPVNLSDEYRYGFEFNINYSPYKWWKLNSNFNFFQNNTRGSFTYTLANSNTVVYQNFDNNASSWFARISSKVTLPYKIDWQTNGTYNAPQKNAQGSSLGVLSANLAFSKDLLKDKATLSLNVNDVFNSRKRISQTTIPGLDSYSEMQWRKRQINLSFTYRFNKQKSEKEKQPKGEGDGGGGDFPG
ncbi:TonB-dependent receptor [Flavobacterium sp. SUN052]|uniref:TonB-dependent receptor domain-containing protein n=1 Tax=Flavobacterium sp. SUN052 TaxID=3002441 RepID=UPI00237EAF09|nr:TonB-dependent receptor [Flavobacterium sp. SUN052]MEC4005228.1 TonB-dependent receptor [Flavobacterium sp. SUN052]